MGALVDWTMVSFLVLTATINHCDLENVWDYGPLNLRRRSKARDLRGRASESRICIRACLTVYLRTLVTFCTGR